MALREQVRRPLVPILLLVAPVVIVVFSVARTEATPRRIELPGGIWVMTTMNALHGSEMAKFAVALVAALVGLFVMQAALAGDRRLVVAGFRPRETVLARLLVLVSAVGVVAAVAAVVAGLEAAPVSWPPVMGALVLVGLIYGAIGALAGVLLDKLAGTYLILFLVMADLGVVQTPMFHAAPSRLAVLLPGYAPTRLMLDGAYSQTFTATAELVLAIGWVVAVAATVYFVLRRALGARSRSPSIVYPIRVFERS
jgi:hypothetical protein